METNKLIQITHLPEQDEITKQAILIFGALTVIILVAALFSSIGAEWDGGGKMSFKDCMQQVWVYPAIPFSLGLIVVVGRIIGASLGFDMTPAIN